MDGLIGPLVFAGIFALFGFIIHKGVQTGRRRRAELDAKAAEAGWSITREAAGRVTETLIRPQGGGWVLRLRPASSHKSGKSRTQTPGLAEITVADPVWPDGMAIFAQKAGPSAMGGALAKAMGGLGGLMETGFVRSMVSRVLGEDFATFGARLQPFEPPAGIELMILATEDPRGADLDAIHRAVQGWKPVKARDQGPPTLIIGPQGTRLRLSYCLHEVEDIAAFADTGLALAAALRTR